MEPLPLSFVTGVWRCVRTEVPPPYDPDQEVVHFTAHGVHACEYRLPEVKCLLVRFRYELTEGGARVETTAGKFRHFLGMRREGDLLAVTPPHDRTFWLERIPGADLPPLPPLCREPLPSPPPEEEEGGRSSPADTPTSTAGATP